MNRYVMCINNEDYPLDLTLHKVYKVIPDSKAEQHGQVRIIDDSGEDYLFSVKRFAPVELDEAGVQSLDKVRA